MHADNGKKHPRFKGLHPRSSVFICGYKVWFFRVRQHAPDIENGRASRLSMAEYINKPISTTKTQSSRRNLLGEMPSFVSCLCG